MKSVFTLLLVTICMSAYARKLKESASAYAKGSIHLDITMPFANQFYYNLGPYDEAKGGFLGICAGGDYAYNKDRFVAIHAGVGTDAPIPFPAPFRYGDMYSRLNAQYIRVQHGHAFNRFTMAYGPMLSRHRFNMYEGMGDTASYNKLPVKKYENIGAGVAVSGYYRFNRFMYIGLLYHPQVLSLSNTTQFKYEHFISADVMFKIGLRNTKRLKLSDRIQLWRAKRSKTGDHE